MCIIIGYRWLMRVKCEAIVFTAQCSMTGRQAKRVSNREVSIKKNDRGKSWDVRFLKFIKFVKRLLFVISFYRLQFTRSLTVRSYHAIFTWNDIRMKRNEIGLAIIEIDDMKEVRTSVCPSICLSYKVHKCSVIYSFLRSSDPFRSTPLANNDKYSTFSPSYRSEAIS